MQHTHTPCFVQQHGRSLSREIGIVVVEFEFEPFLFRKGGKTNRVGHPHGNTGGDPATAPHHGGNTGLRRGDPVAGAGGPGQQPADLDQDADHRTIARKLRTVAPALRRTAQRRNDSRNRTHVDHVLGGGHRRHANDPDPQGHRNAAQGHHLSDQNVPDQQEGVPHACKIPPGFVYGIVEADRKKSKGVDRGPGRARQGFRVRRRNQVHVVPTVHSAPPNPERNHRRSGYRGGGIGNTLPGQPATAPATIEGPPGIFHVRNVRERSGEIRKVPGSGVDGTPSHEPDTQYYY
mmetsp:Transcript_3809/g.8552  ORF Transcript_3809/g.8552 Transcript_3809/m.8552 type:complete len:291 (-) Transcript_3809:1040-1912(-)